MKIAVCLGGNLRGYEKLQMKWNGLHEAGIDLFLSTWDYKGVKLHNSNPSHKRYHQYNFDDQITFSIQDLQAAGFTAVEIEHYYPDYYTRFHQQLAPLAAVRRLHTPYDPFIENTTSSFEHHIAFLAQWHKRWRSFELCMIHQRRAGIRYDMILLGRPDTFVTIPYETLDPNMLHVSIARDDAHDLSKLHDIYAVGTDTLLREYAMLYPRFDYCIHTLQTHHTGILAAPSTVLYRYLTSLQLPLAPLILDQVYKATMDY